MHFSDTDLLTIAGYWLGCYGTGWGIGALFLWFHKMTERI